MKNKKIFLIPLALTLFTTIGVIAEEEGSTIIRVGSAIFGARDYSRK